MDYKAKTLELYEIRREIADTIGERLKPQPVGHLGIYTYYNRLEFELFQLYNSLQYKPGSLTVTLP